MKTILCQKIQTQNLSLKCEFWWTKSSLKLVSITQCHINVKSFKVVSPL